MASKADSGGPNLSTALFAGFLTLLLGALLGLVSLITQPVTAVTREPDPGKLEPGEVIYVQGARRGNATWTAKEVALKNRRLNQLALSEPELNQWSQKRLAIPEDAPEEDSGWSGRLRVTANPVNFRILEDRVQLGTELKLPGLFPNAEFRYFVVGEFKEKGGSIVFVPESGNLGHAPLGSIPLARDWLFGFVTSRFTKATDVNWLPEALAEFDAVNIREKQLVFSRTAAN